MILVTGATGKVGTHVVEQLIERRTPVRAFVRDAVAARERFGDGVEIAVGDLERVDTLRPAMEGVTALFLLSPGDLRQTEIQNRVVDVAAEAGVRRVVKLSALGAGPQAPFRLGRMHWETEQHIARSGLEYTILRPTVFLENLLGFAPAQARQGSIFAPLGDARVAMVAARDIAAVAVAALTEDGHDGKIYNVTGPEAISFDDIAAAVGEALGQPVRYVPVGLDEVRDGMVAQGTPEWFADDMRALNRAFASGGGELVSPTVPEVTGAAGTTLDRFVREHADAFRSAA